MTGIVTRKGTTIFTVKEVDFDIEMFITMIRTSEETAGFKVEWPKRKSRPEGEPADDWEDDFFYDRQQAMAESIVDVAEEFEPGELLYVNDDYVIERRRVNGD